MSIIFFKTICRTKPTLKILFPTKTPRKGVLDTISLPRTPHSLSCAQQKRARRRQEKVLQLSRSLRLLSLSVTLSWCRTCRRGFVNWIYAYRPMNNITVIPARNSVGPTKCQRPGVLVRTLQSDRARDSI